jgi:hypothetical protein
VANQRVRLMIRIRAAGGKRQFVNPAYAAKGRLSENMLRQSWPDPFAEIKFPGAPLGMYGGRPWFLPAVGAWFKFLDWIR